MLSLIFHGQLPQGASKVGNPGFQFHVVPAVPYLQPHVGAQPGNKQMVFITPHSCLFCMYLLMYSIDLSSSKCNVL